MGDVSEPGAQPQSKPGAPVSAGEASVASRHGWAPAEPLRRPVLFVNPRSGGGKAERAGLVERARARGLETIVLDPDSRLETLVADAVARGADALGMAGGGGGRAGGAAGGGAPSCPLAGRPP